MGFIREANDVLKNSVNPVNPIPSLIVGIVAFLIFMIITYFVYRSYQNRKKSNTYDWAGCQLDENGKRIILDGTDDRGRVTYHETCIQKTSGWTFILVGALVSLLIASSLSLGVYSFQFNVANPKVGAGLYVTERLLH